jgi:hypothetical protein
MAVVAGNPVWVTLKANAQTPAGLTQYAERIVGLPEGTVAPAGYDVLTVSGLSIPGTAQQIAGQWTWLMGPAQDPLITALDAIPGAGGWSSPSARQVYLDQGAALLRDYGVTAATLLPGLKQFYDAAVAEHLARSS